MTAAGGGRFRLLVSLLVLLPWAVSPLRAQEERGVVAIHVHSGGVPLAGAEVRAREGRSLTDDEGNARLSLPAGDVRIEVRRLGHERGVVQVRVVAGRDTPVVVELRPEALEIEGVVITSTRTGRRVQDEPIRVEVLDREEIEEKALMTPGNIAMLLNETGGLRVQVTSPSLGGANIRVQGMRGRYTQLLADGLPLYGGQAGSIGLLQIPPTDLGQVEVIKGAASALYGASALGGVVNLVARRPDEDQEMDLLVNVTSQGGQDLTAYLAGPLSEEWGYSVAGGAHRQSLQDLDGRGWADVPEHRRWTVRPRLFWSGEGGRAAFVTVGGMTERREGGALPGGTLPDGSDFTESLDTDRLDAGLLVRYPVSDLGFVQVRASGMTQGHRHRFGDGMEDDRHGTLFGEAALTGAAGRHTWVVGAAVHQDVYRSETFPGFDYTFTVPGVFVQDEIGFSPDLRASASLRWDAHSEYGSHVSPRVSALYRPGPWTARISVGGGFFAPTPFVEEIEAAGLSRLMPLHELRSERAWTASLDLGRTIRGLELNATLFGSRVLDAVHLLPFDDGTPDGEGAGVRLANVDGETRTAGTELLARHRWDDITIAGSYVYVRASEPWPTGPGRREVPLTPRHTAGLVAVWEDHDRGLLGVEAYYTGGQPLDDNPYRDEGRPQLHLGILGELRRGAFSLFLNAENLLDVRQTRYDPLIRDRRAPDGRWTVDAWAPLEGFTLNGGVRVRLGGH